MTGISRRQIESTESTMGMTSNLQALHSGITLSWEQIEGYLNKLETSGYSQTTVKSYRRNLERLYRFLPEEKYIESGTLAAWRDEMLRSGYSARTVNASIAAVNGLMHHLGHRDIHVDRLSETEEYIQPELTRSEYLRLLSTARALGKERAYLLIKLFGTTGLAVGELESLTVEAVQVGEILLPSGTLRIPKALGEELLHFAQGEGIASGPVFLSREGTPQERTVVTAIVKSLCQDAKVPEEKGNPRCLRKLYLTTQAGILENLSLLAEQAYDRLLEKEQRMIGWELEIV